MSERSLRRALADEETSFRDVLDDVRRTIALEMLQANQSVTEIAFLLGFSETSALSRAFRRWHGKSIRSQRIGAR
jgi:AraC-like DNA-binding protein